MCGPSSGGSAFAGSVPVTGSGARRSGVGSPDTTGAGETAASWSSGSSAGFWYFGVNFRPHSLHRRRRRMPSRFVFRTPLLTVSLEPHFGHLYGLPMINHLTGHGRGLSIKAFRFPEPLELSVGGTEFMRGSRSAMRKGALRLGTLGPHCGVYASNRVKTLLL